VSVLSDAAARDLARTCPTPFYAVHPDHVAAEFNRLRDAVTARYPRVALGYSVKTNYLPLLIRRVHAEGHLVEVVSRHELDYVRGLGIPDADIILNGPGKRPVDLRDALAAGVRVNLDSLEELRAVRDLADATGVAQQVGLRVSPHLSADRRSRFGILLPESLATVREICGDGAVRITGLHVHFSTDRSADSYAHRVRLLTRTALELGITPDYLDIGGGLASALHPGIRAQLDYDVSSFEEYGAAIGSAMTQEWGVDGPLLVLEPGTATLSASLSYVTSVVSARSDGVAVIDGSMFDVNPLRSRVTPPLRVVPHSGGDPAPGRSGVFGGTCMEIDTLGVVPEVAMVGDLVVIDNVGAYTLVLSPEFILPRARIVDADSGVIIRGDSPLGQLGGFR